MASARGGSSLTLAKFHAFLERNREEALACHRQTMAIREKTLEVFQREMVAWHATFATCYAQLAERRHEMPPDFAQHIDRVEQEELTRIRQEIADLAKEIEEKQARSDKLLASARAEVESLRETNPGLNEREEELKALMVKYQDEYSEAYEQQESLEENTWGWLTNFVEIRRLSRKQKEAKKRQNETLLELRNVRQDWLKQVEQVGDTQAKLREEWQQVGVRLAEAQTQHDHLSQNLADLAEQDALTRVLEELDDPPDLHDELGEALQDLAARNRVRRAYERALEVSGEFLGRVKGIANGLEKFAGSVAEVVREQRRYNLKQVRVRLPESVVEMLGAWNQVRSAFHGMSGTENKPIELTRLLEPYNQRVLSDRTIEALFKTMGDALTRATDAWK